MDANDVTSLGLLLEVAGFSLLCAEWLTAQKFDLANQRAELDSIRSKRARLTELADQHRRVVWMGESFSNILKADFEERLRDVHDDLDRQERTSQAREHRMRYFELGCFFAVIGNGLQYYAVEYMT